MPFLLFPVLLNKILFSNKVKIKNRPKLGTTYLEIMNFCKPSLDLFFPQIFLPVEAVWDDTDHKVRRDLPKNKQDLLNPNKEKKKF